MNSEEFSANEIPAEPTHKKQPGGKPGRFWGGLVVGIVAGVAGCLIVQKVDGNLNKRFDYDLNGDGKTDQSIYMKNGLYVAQKTDRNFDGRWDEWYDFENGILARVAVDDNFDGQADGWWTCSNGLFVSFQKDTDYNGVPDVTCTYKDGRIVKSEWQPNGTNIITLRELFPNGNFAEEFRDIDGDGWFDLNIKFDAFLKPIQTNNVHLPSRPRP